MPPIPCELPGDHEVFDLMEDRTWDRFAGQSQLADPGPCDRQCLRTDRRRFDIVGGRLQALQCRSELAGCVRGLVVLAEHLREVELVRHWELAPVEEDVQVV